MTPASLRRLVAKGEGPTLEFKRSTGELREGIELLDALPVTRGREHVREVAVAGAGGAAERRIGVAGDPDGWPARLKGPRRKADGFRAEVSPDEAHAVLPPEPAHEVQGLVRPPSALG